jgi:trehalose 6-phosphate phosphatase
MIERNKLPTDIWSDLAGVRTRLSTARKLFLFLDFDGTLAPIVSVPSLAVLPEEFRRILRAMSVSTGVVPVIISGRTIDDLQERVGLPLVYAGDHGLEIRGMGLEYTVPAARVLRHRLLSICNRLRSIFEYFEGVLVECKKFTASVHVRQVEPSRLSMVCKLIEEHFEDERDFQLSVGKKVYEIRPRIPWNKGSAARWILEQFGGNDSNAICMGDDVTDEDLFEQLPNGISVRVGLENQTNAHYSIDESAIRRFLDVVHESIKNNRAVLN